MNDNDMNYDAIEKLLWGLGGQLTCESQSDVLTAFRQLHARVAELEAMRVYWTCKAGGETFTTHKQDVADEWSGDGMEVTRHVASDETAKRIAELEAKNGRLRNALHDAICCPKGVVPDTANEFYEPMWIVQGEAQRMGLYGGSEE